MNCEFEPLEDSEVPRIICMVHDRDRIACVEAERDSLLLQNDALRKDVERLEGYTGVSFMAGVIRERDEALRLYSELRKLAWACVGEVGMNDTLRPMEEFLKRTETERPKCGSCGIDPTDHDEETCRKERASEKRNDEIKGIKADGTWTTQDRCRRCYPNPGIEMSCAGVGGCYCGCHAECEDSNYPCPKCKRIHG